MIVLTGVNGFIGNNLYKKIRKIYKKRILLIEDFSINNNIRKYDDKIIDFRDCDFLQLSKNRIEAIFHLGAITDTTFSDSKIINFQNTEFSINLYESIKNTECKFIYASSASVYGKNFNSIEEPVNEKPINLYSHSKLNFDNYIREQTNNFTNNQKVFGLRYFNVYGPGEDNKGKMASVVLHFYNQIVNEHKIKLFVGSDGFENGEQKRDFIYVEDVTNVTLDMFLENYQSGIFNLGTGEATTFNRVANIIIENLNYKNKIKIEYIDFPDNLLRGYQSYTKADLSNFIKNGLAYKFYKIEEGINSYLEVLKK